VLEICDDILLELHLELLLLELLMQELLLRELLLLLSG